LNTVEYGPQLSVSQAVHTTKYRSEGEGFFESQTRLAANLSDDEVHRKALKPILLDMRFMFAGRIQAAIGAPRATTPYNCFVSGTIPDSMDGIMDRAKEAALTMKMGGGIGYDFSTLRPDKDLIRTLGSVSSGPISFMKIFDAVCGTVSSAGHRRGAQMGVIRVDHPNIEEFIHAKMNSDELTNFNLSVAITDEFMEAVINDSMFDLTFEGRVYKTVKATNLWDMIMRMNWEWAEPGVLFIDIINRMNNLRYCETIAATNPCAEQPLPPYGACLLGSFNLVKYVIQVPYRNGHCPTDIGYEWDFDWVSFKADIPHIVRALDNVIDQALYPLPEHEAEAKAKRRMGIGFTGLANAGEAVTGSPYGSEEFLKFADEVAKVLAQESYKASIQLAKEKGPFPLYDQIEYHCSEHLDILDEDILNDLWNYGIRNSHLISIAPTGTISLSADNVSSGCEPVFALKTDRDVIMPEGKVTFKDIEDYGYRVFGVKGKTSEEVSVDDHLSVLLTMQRYSDSAVSKTCNIGDHVTFNEFKEIYMKAWKGGAKGCTTFRLAGSRFGIMKKSEEVLEEGAACFIDPATGNKTCE